MGFFGMETKPTILIADDEFGMRLLIGEALAQNGLNVIEAEDGPQAVALFTASHPDLVLLDVVMPTLDGFQTCRAIRARKGGADVPIMILTSDEERDTIRAAYEAGATDFCAKPVPWLILCERVRYMLRASRTAQKLQQSRELLNRAQTIARMGSFVYRPADGYLQVSDAFRNLCGFAGDLPLNWEAFWRTIDSRDQSVLAPALHQLLHFGGSLQQDIRLISDDERERFATLRIDRDADDTRHESRFIGILQDITERKLSELQEADQSLILQGIVRKEPLDQVFDAAVKMLERNHPRGMGLICLLEDNRIKEVFGPKVPKSFRVELEHHVLTGEESAFIASIGPGRAEIADALANSAFWRNRRQQLLAEGIRASSSLPIFSGSGQVLGFVSLLHRDADHAVHADLDLIEKTASLTAMAVVHRQLSQNLIHQAQHDPLSGLLNRGALTEILSQTLKQSARAPAIGAYLLIDLDRFKQINDSLGHHVGDILLTQVADRFRESVREGDVLSRVGGDEFVVVQPGLREKEDAARGAMRILEHLNQPFLIEGHMLHMEASIGISLFPSDAGDPTTLHKNADIAMYVSKNKGGNRFSFFDSRMQAVVIERLEMENDLRKAIERNAFELHYQPQVDLSEGKIVAMEALIRWNHPTCGCIPPDRFIAVAEESRLIIPIGQWALREACRQNKAWQNQGLAPVRVAVNVSAVQFNDKDFVRKIEQVLAETALSPRWLEIEITETAVMQNQETACAALHAIRALGITTTLDDFGTGYSSITYLRQMPLDGIKIDRSFISDLENAAAGGTERNHTLVKALINLARDLDLSLLAEGIETEAQRRFLLDAGCKIGQGFLFSHPLPAEDISTLLMNRLK